MDVPRNGVSGWIRRWTGVPAGVLLYTAKISTIRNSTGAGCCHSRCGKFTPCG